MLGRSDPTDTGAETLAPPTGGDEFDGEPDGGDGTDPRAWRGRARHLGKFLDGRHWPWFAAALDAVVLAVAALLALGTTTVGSRASLFLLAVFPLAGVLALAHGRSRSHRLDGGILDDLWPIIALVSVSSMMTLGLARLVALDATHDSTVVTAWALALVLLILIQALVRTLRRRLRNLGLSGRPTLIVGAGAVGKRVAHWLETRPQFGLRPVGFLDWPPPPGAPKVGSARTLPVLGPPSELARHLHETGTEHVVLAFAGRPDHHLVPLMRSCTELGVEVSIVPRFFEHTHVRMSYEPIGGLPVLGIGADAGRGRRLVTKYVLDRLAAAFLLVLASPLMAAIAISILLTAGRPVTFRQRRLGEDGREFDLLKFCTMRGADADPTVLPDLEADRAPGGVGDDDRRTSMGGLLRRTSLDELMQLVNVIRGEMSLVGPRPERPAYVELFSDSLDRYADRHRVRPGITGLAQVQGLRGSTSLAERIELDNYYIEQWSFTLDAKILLRTVRAAFRVPE